MSRVFDCLAARLAAASVTACFGAAVLMPAAARAQDKPAWFVPSPGKPAAPAAAPAARPAPRAARAAAAPGPQPGPLAEQGGAPDQQDEQPDAVPQYNLPALAPLPALPKTAAPPSAVIGVLGIPDVMRASTASQLVQKVIGARRDKLAADYQKEQQVWRDMQQALVNQRSTLPAEQLQAREKQLQDRVAAETKQFRARNRIIQEAGQFSLAQIERVLVAVIRQVSESRGMNLVLHRQQVALNVSEFDITDQVTAQLNTLLAAVTIPPDGEEPSVANANTVLTDPGAVAPVTAHAPTAPPTKK